MEKVLKKIYYNPSKSGSFGGVNSLARASKVNRKDIQKWFQTQDIYTLHKPARKTYQRRKTISLGINDLYQADLVDMQAYAKDNRGYKYILNVIDCFSKKAFAVPVKNKTGHVIVKAFKTIFKKQKPRLLQSDQGTEFFNRPVQTYLKSLGISHYHTFSNVKASIVERFNRTLLTKMFRFFTHKGSHRYLEVLPQLIKSYNNSFHRSIQMAPNQVNAKNSSMIFERMFGSLPKFTQKLKVGDLVRVSKAKWIFQKGYLPNYSHEVFSIHLVKPPIYILKDLQGELIKGSFYEAELQKIIKKDDVWPIEKVIKKKGNSALVKWKGFPDKFNSWIDYELLYRFSI